MGDEHFTVGANPYMEHLRVLNSRRPVAEVALEHEIPVRLQHRLQQVNTPLVWQEWERVLAAHPDRKYRNYIHIFGGLLQSE